MLKKISKLQEELLKVNNYFVLPELYVIKDNSSDKPYFNIYFDPNSGEFGLQVFPVVMLRDIQHFFQHFRQNTADFSSGLNASSSCLVNAL